MKFVPSEFSNSAWDIFILAKEIAHNNYQQNVDSENIFLALLKQDTLTSKILKKNCRFIKQPIIKKFSANICLRRNK